MKPSTITSLVFAVTFGVGSIGLALWFFFMEKDGDGVKWHFWLAPILMIGLGALLAQLTATYWVKVGRTEMRSRPPVD